MRHTRFSYPKQDISEDNILKHEMTFQKLIRIISLWPVVSPNTRLFAQHLMPHLYVFGRL